MAGTRDVQTEEGADATKARSFCKIVTLNIIRFFLGPRYNDKKDLIYSQHTRHTQHAQGDVETKGRSKEGNRDAKQSPEPQSGEPVNKSPAPAVPLRIIRSNTKTKTVLTYTGEIPSGIKEKGGLLQGALVPAQRIGSKPGKPGQDYTNRPPGSKHSKPEQARIDYPSGFKGSSGSKNSAGLLQNQLLGAQRSVPVDKRRDWTNIRNSGTLFPRDSHTKPKWGDILTWQLTGPAAGPTRTSIKRKTDAMADVVQDWGAPEELAEPLVVNYGVFKALDKSDKEKVIENEAEHYGIVKPKGYTVSFHYNPEVEYHHFGSSHPMKPWRLTLTKQLILAYGLEYSMDIYCPPPANIGQLEVFHDRGYLDFLHEYAVLDVLRISNPIVELTQNVSVTPRDLENLGSAKAEKLHGFGFAGDSNDCPVFDGLWNYVSLYSGASLHAADRLLNKDSDIAINWSGGLHHAKKNAASGFCYVNDIVLAIQQLLTQNPRVLYIDIDVHHGDGVEHAFENSDRVFTLSYHKFGKDKWNQSFFPGTGDITDVGPTDPSSRGKGHTLNIPFDDGIDDEQYRWVFKVVTGAVIQKYQPTVIVLQCGADSLGGDRLGRFNLNIKAHGFCVEFVKSFNIQLLLIGGGGYTPRNVARTWCHETAVCTGIALHNHLPTHLPYISAFTGAENGNGVLYPDLRNTKRHENNNTDPGIRELVARALENLRYIEGAPSVVANDVGLTEAAIMRIRASIDEEFRDRAEDRETRESEKTRRRHERNIGGRGEHRFR
jgi:histone deacetylase HOS2